jgi:hypothetical protein
MEPDKFDWNLNLDIHPVIIHFWLALKRPSGICSVTTVRGWHTKYSSQSGVQSVKFTPIY